MNPRTRTKFSAPNKLTQTSRNPKQKTGRLFIRSITTSIKIFLIILSVFGVFLFYVWQHSKIDQLAKELDQLNQQARALENANERLNVSIANLSSYNRIESIAREQLQLKPVKEKPVVVEIPDLDTESEMPYSGEISSGSILPETTVTPTKKTIEASNPDNGKSLLNPPSPTRGAAPGQSQRPEADNRLKSKKIKSVDPHSPKPAKQKDKN